MLWRVSRYVGLGEGRHGRLSPRAHTSDASALLVPTVE